MNRQRLIGAAVLLLALFVVRPAGAADEGLYINALAEHRAVVAKLAKRILDDKRLPCESVRFVDIHDTHTINVVCGYSYEYTIDLDAGAITQKEWPSQH